MRDQHQPQVYCVQYDDHSKAARARNTAANVRHVTTSNPLELLTAWIEEAAERGFPLPANATLATVDADGQPSSRVVTIRGITSDAIRFASTLYTRKATDIKTNPRVSLHLFWPGAGQVHLAGTASIADREAAEKLFAAKNHSGQLLIHATRQGAPIDGLDDVRDAVSAAESELTEPLDCPPDWGAIDITPHTVEFWRPGKGGLHTRILHRRRDNDWDQTHLTP